MRRREEEVRDDFHRAGALQALDARSLADVGLEENHTIHRLMKRSIVRESAPGLFYFDEEVWQSVHAMRRRMVLLLLVVVALAGVAALYGVATVR
ncbi:MAG: hypothetical protein ACRD3J_22755 [Thermoanaerobaculia bacterium]